MLTNSCRSGLAARLASFSLSIIPLICVEIRQELLNLFSFGEVHLGAAKLSCDPCNFRSHVGKRLHQFFLQPVIFAQNLIPCMPQSSTHREIPATAVFCERGPMNFIVMLDNTITRLATLRASPTLWSKTIFLLRIPT